MTPTPAVPASSAAPRRPRRLVLTAVICAAAAACAVATLRRRQLRWGARDDELTAALPGDGLVPGADLVATRAISIEAEVQDVVPWLRQLGWGRGGFYTYTRLENLLRLGLHNAETIHPEWQVAQGDDVHLADGVPLRVAELTPAALVLQGVEHGGERPGQPPMPYEFSWAFVVVPEGEGSRLVVRERYRYLAGWGPLVVEPVTWVSWLMTHGMLRGIRARAEASRDSRP